MYAVKGNICENIKDDENEARARVKLGYDVVDEKGKVIMYGDGKMIALNEYLKLKNELDALKASISEKSEAAVEKTSEKKSK